MVLDRAAGDQVNMVWDEIVPVLHDPIAISKVSDTFDRERREHGDVQHLLTTCRLAPAIAELLDPHAYRA